MTLPEPFALAGVKGKWIGAFAHFAELGGRPTPRNETEDKAAAGWSQV